MCGRYASTRSAADLSALFEAADESAAELRPDYNLAPTDPAPVVRLSGDGGRVLAVGRFGLVPHWAPDPRAGARMINARAETVATTRAYAAAFASRRCLVPADGWYEWVPGAVKQAYFMTPADGAVLALAGVWTRWGPDRLLTFSVVTTAAVGALAAVHDRMPLVLPAARWAQWLGEGGGPPAPPADLLRPPAPELVSGLEIRPVGPAVGNVYNDGPSLVKRVNIVSPGEPDQPALF